LCVWLQVRGYDRCGSDDNYWDYERINKKIEDEKQQQTTFVLPLATIIETGNHIAQASGDKITFINSFIDVINASADNQSPWAAFTEQSELWAADNLKLLAEKWRDTAQAGQSLGDAAIVDVANHYAQLGYTVEILTGDEGLKSYEPLPPVVIPRRRK